MLYEITGIVQRGKGMGTQLGFPTANLAIEAAPAIPHGVYAGQALAQGTWYPAVINIGRHPTLPEGPPTIEAHLLHCALKLYGQPLTLRLIRYLRPEQRFPSVEALREQLRKDVGEVEGTE